MTDPTHPERPADRSHSLRVYGSPSRLPKPTRVNVHVPGPFDLFVIDHARWATLGPEDRPEEFRVAAPGVYFRFAWAGDDQLK